MFKKELKKDTTALVFRYNKLSKKNIIIKNMIEYKENKFHPFNDSSEI